MTTTHQHQLAVLSNLCPETVIGLTDVGFITRAMALPGVIEVSESLGEVEYVGENGADGDLIDVGHALRLTPDVQERAVTMEKFIVAGGLCYDQDADGPLEKGSANGNIYHRGRRGHRDEESQFYESIGFDRQGNKDLTAEAVSAELAKRVTAEIRKDRSLMATLRNLLCRRGDISTWDAVLARITVAIHREGWEYALDYVASYFLDVSWWQDVAAVWKDKLDPLADLLCESEAEVAWDRAVASGTIGNPLAVMLDIYEHSGISYSLAGHGMQCGWDTSRFAAVWVPDADAEENIRYNVLHALGVGQVRWSGALGSQDDPLHARYSLDGATWHGVGYNWSWQQAMDAMLVHAGQPLDEARMKTLHAAEAKKYCKGILEEYNAWCNGEVFGVVVYVIDRETGKRIKDQDDECWGHIGREYAETTLEDAILSQVLRLGATYH